MGHIKKKFNRIFWLGVLVISSCYLPTDPGPQPHQIVETHFKPGFNVLGVLRNDGNAGSSFLHVERVYKIQEATDDFVPTIDDAQVQIQRLSDSRVTGFGFTEDSLRGKIYTDSTFVPWAGERYQLKVSGEDFPDVTGEVTIPPAPRIDSSSVMVNNHLLSFQTMFQPEIRLYEAYLICQNATYHLRQRSESTGPTTIAFDLTSGSGVPQSLIIYGYEKNLTEYLTAPITIKPQTYRELVTTVSGGYGVFGAVSVVQYQF